MGGTSADVGLIADGEFGSTTSYEIEWGVPVSALFIDYTTIGAGGGSIAYIDSGGLLRVGPKSAGAEPGPACYGQGGTEPTVTDANVVLGRLDPDFFLGGRMKLDAALARRALKASRNSSSCRSRRPRWRSSTPRPPTWRTPRVC